MALQEQINKDLKNAMKSGDRDRLRTLRMIKTRVSQKKSEGSGGSVTDDTVLDAVNKLVKQARESIEEYEKAGREDLAEEERTELEILKDYLPEEPDEDEIDAVIEEVIEEVGATDMRDMGQVMKSVMGRFEDVPVDGNTVNQKVRDRLA